jgi:hypothetical protein
MLKYFSKFAMDILPSVAATVIGGYIVNHYISRPAVEAPSAAAVSVVDPKRSDPASGAKPSETIETATGVAASAKARTLDKALAEMPPLDRPAAEKSLDLGIEKPADRAAETASLAPEPRRHQAAPRDKSASRIAVPVAAPAGAPPGSQMEAAVPPEEHRDANDLARAAIERLRGASDASSRTPEATRLPEPARVAAAPALPVAVVPVRPLPPPIVVAQPPGNSYDTTPGSQGRPYYPTTVGLGDPSRPVPPADIPSIPVSPPLNLHADASGVPMQEHKTVAEGMLSAARSVFQAVLPK